ncbi:PH domain-containing protein [Carbonactinospora thermoautotrophica]|uniref:PH domain-containing protein n=1 Tax=Carbonactinospora thermoautotrophica TaxID=1469144 RepID=UPI002270F659|nr:PH domain-containing protein [Carbonactinospora thermoautotrophica]
MDSRIDSRMDAAFAPPQESWIRVSPRLRIMRRILLVAWGVPVTAVLAGVAGWFAPWLAAVVVLAGLALGGWGWWLIGRNYASWGYAEREDDLLITHGFMFRELVVVPYGRMQFVDVKAGPVERKFGIASVQLHTASPGTDARIPGIPPEEAARLRDRLTELGEARLAGL